MDIRKHFGTNQKAEEAGTWVDIGQGARIRVARNTNTRYREKLRDILRPYRGAISANALDDKTSHALLAKAFAGTVLLDWQGIEEDGKPLAYTIEDAERLLRDAPEFYRSVESFASDVGLFRDQSESAEQKN